MAEQLTTLKISNGALKGDKLPARLKIFGWGDNQSTKGTFRAGDKTVQLLSSRQKALGLERIPLDFDHCTIQGTPTNKQLMEMGIPPIIFGYGRPNAIAGDGIYLEDIAWTPMGERFAKNFEDLSPAVADENGEVTLVGSCALTPTGAVEGLHFFSTAKEPGSKDSGHDSPPAGYPKNADHYADPKNFKYPIDTAEHCTAAWNYLHQEKNQKDYSEDELKFMFGRIMRAGQKLGCNFSDDAKKSAGMKTNTTTMLKDQVLNLLSVAAAMGLPDTTEPEAVLAELANRLKPAAAPDLTPLSSRIEAMEKKAPAGADLTPLTSRLDALEKKIGDTEKAATDMQRGNLIALFAKDGKVPRKADGSNYSAEELQKLDVPTLQLLHANTPVTVPLNARNAAHQTEGGQAKFRVKGPDGKERVDLGAVFDDENTRLGVGQPNI